MLLYIWYEFCQFKTMKHILAIIFSIGFSTMICAQQEFHVFPKSHNETPGREDGTGTLDNPWDLQTALNQKPDVVNGGDVIWLHKGVYNGRYISKIKSLEPDTYITVSAYNNERVIINGNVESSKEAVLEVRGKQVIFKNFEITWLGEFSRDQKDSDFKSTTGLRHLAGENCRFYSLKIYNVPGLGMGSWKHGAATIIQDCMIYNNGFMSKVGKGGGEGIYVQNKSDEVRLIKNNIIFNNYYKGIEVWSAGKNAKYQYVKNITLDHNIIFNSGSPSGVHRDNVIVASDDRNGINIAENISVLNNVFYHNTKSEKGVLLGNAPSLSLGFNHTAPIENVVVDNNIIVGGYNALRLLLAKSLRFTNNTIYTGNVQIGPRILDFYQHWDFNYNTIYCRRSTPYRITRTADHSLNTWRRDFQLDIESKVIPITKFKLDSVLHISNHSQHKNKYTVALFDKKGNDVVVDFSEYNVKPRIKFKIYDVENPNVVAKSGQVPQDFKITFPMQLTAFEKPLHNMKAKKTVSDFGVFIIEFDEEVLNQTPKEKDNFLIRFFKWLGF